MNYIIKDREPANVFRFFEEICAIPHGSGNEKGIADYLEAFARERGIEYKRDHVHNVFMWIPASAGRENEPSVMLQAHTDMVCEKNEGTEHDFLTDPLELYLDGEYLRARGTTLGADDGIGVALILSVLDGSVLSHPAIEALFTVSEETGMDGVENFDFSQVKSRKLINLDSCDINTIICGCAGGLRETIHFDGELETNKMNAVNIKLGGLAGGHSGENINDGRASANKLMGRFLARIGELSLVTINGGGKINAIPRECVATVALNDVDGVYAAAKAFEAEIKNELSAIDGEFFIEITPAGVPERAFSVELSHRIVNTLRVLADGVLKMSYKVEGLVEYSRNLGVIITKGDTVEFLIHDRSGINAQLDETCREITALAELAGAKVDFGGRYGGWDFAAVSPLRDSYAAAAEKVTGKPIKIESIHAGLECGFIVDRIPDMDIIAVGPDMIGIHSPDERLELNSVETIFKIIVEVLSK